MYNKVIMAGRLTRDIELRYLPSGLGVANSSIATSHNYKSKDGEKKEEVCFLEFSIFGRTAEIANQYLKKGSRVLLEGRLVLESWTGQDGSKRSRHTLRVENMRMLETKAESVANNGGSSYGGGQQNGYNQPATNNYEQNQYNNTTSSNSYSSPSNSYPDNGGVQNQGFNQKPSKQSNIPDINVDDINEDSIPF